MSDKLPAEFDIYIDRLADTAHEALEGNATLTREDVRDDVQGLAKAGFDEREGGPPLGVLIENRVLEKYQEPTIHRRAELTALLRTITEAWTDASDFTQHRS